MNLDHQANTITSNADKVAQLPGANGTLALLEDLAGCCILETVYTITDAAAFELDPANGTIQKVTLGANRTPLATNFEVGHSITLKVRATAYTLDWSSMGITWIGGVIPSMATVGYTTVVLWKDSDGMNGKLIGDSAGTTPELRAAATTISANFGPGTTTLTAPTNKDGDLLVMAITGENLTSVTTLSGWANILTSSISGGRKLYVFTKTANSEPASYNWTVADRFYSAFIASFAYGQVDVIGSVTGDADMTAYTSASVTATAAGLLLNIAQVNDDSSFTTPSGMLEVVDVSNTALYAVTITLDTQIIAAGATGTRTGACASNSAGSSVLISLKK